MKGWTSPWEFLHDQLFEKLCVVMGVKSGDRHCVGYDIPDPGLNSLVLAKQKEWGT